MKSPVEWLINELTKEGNEFLFLCDKPDYMESLSSIIEQAKELENNLLQSFIKSREQTRWSATQIGFAKGFDYALKGSEDYYEKLEKTQESDEYFTRDYLQDKCDEICNIKYPS
jgi:hypothetical protein